MKSLLKFLSFVVFCALLFSPSSGTVLSAGTPVVTPGSDPSAVHLGGVRYRELTTGKDSQVYLGIPDLGDATHRTDTTLGWDTTNAITFSYDPILDKLATSVTNSHGVETLDYPDFSSNLRDLIFGGSQALTDEALGKLNYMQINLRLGENPPAELTLTDVNLDGNPLGDFIGEKHKTLSWQVNGYDFRQGFTLTGNMNIINITSPSAVLNHIEITFGYVNGDTFAPSVSNVTAIPNPHNGSGLVTLTSLVDDSTSGGSIIQSAEYQLDGGAWNSMSASDGTFDSATENVTASFAAPSSQGEHDLCVRGTDSASNTSSGECTSLYVDSQAPLTTSVAVDPTKTGVGMSVNLTALVDDSATGGSAIQSAQYSINGAGWNPMDAQDGNFDTDSEAVIISFPAPAVNGNVNLCVRGTDAAGNTSPQACTTLLVDSQGPLASALQLDPNPADSAVLVNLTASLDDSITGNSQLISAEFQVAGGTWSMMLPQDGSFDSPLEAVSAQFPAPISSGSVAVCVRGTDAFANIGTPTCTQLDITYTPPPLYLPVVLQN